MGKKKGRKRSQKPLNLKRKKTNKYKHSKWKLNYPEYFKETKDFPYIKRRDKNENTVL